MIEGNTLPKQVDTCSENQDTYRQQVNMYCKQVAPSLNKRTLI